MDEEGHITGHKTKEDIKMTLEKNARAIGDLKNEVGYSIAKKINPTKEMLSDVHSAAQGLHKSVA